MPKKPVHNLDISAACRLDVSTNRFPTHLIGTYIYQTKDFFDNPKIEKIYTNNLLELKGLIKTEQYSNNISCIAQKINSQIQLAEAQLKSMNALIKSLEYSVNEKQEGLKKDFANRNSKLNTFVTTAIKDAENKITKQTQESIDSFTTYASSIESKATDEINEQTRKMYSNFVSVLGIFVAISFSLFGAATLINNLFQINSVFSKSENMKEATDVLPKLVGTNIMLGGILTLLIYLLIIGLMSGISRIINKKYDFNIFLLLVVLIISSAIITFGFAYSHKAFIENPWHDFNLISGHFMIISILFSLLLIIAYIGYRINNSFSKREDPKQNFIQWISPLFKKSSKTTEESQES